MKYRLLLCVTVAPLIISGCGLFSTVYYDSKASAYNIAQHNYRTLLASQDNRKDYLLVDKNGMATPKDMFLYINGLREPLEKYKLATQNLIQYNKQIMKELRKNDDD